MGRLPLASGDAQRRYFRRNILVHTHIEKSAGSSLVGAFAELFGVGQVYDLRLHGAARLRDLPGEEKARIRVLSGHFSYRSMDSLFARQKLYIATVREPFERLLSHYRFVMGSPGHGAYPATLDKMPTQVVAGLLAADHPVITNAMSRALGIVTPEVMAAHLEKNYVIVAPCERVDELIAALYRIFGRPDAPTLRYNVGSGEGVSIDREVRRLFLARNQIDGALYDHVRRRFDTWLDHLEERLCRVTPASTIRHANNRLGHRWNCFIKRAVHSSR